jgi:GT2 family glycosyltransferase
MPRQIQAQKPLSELEAIIESGLFDENWYREKGAVAEPGLEAAVRHYITAGVRSGREPHPLFDSGWYLAGNPDQASSGLTPLGHYVMAGRHRQASPHPLLAPHWYAQEAAKRYPDGERPKPSELFLHFLQKGGPAGVSPHPLFDGAYYLSQNPALAAAGINPLSDYVGGGALQGRNPNPFFDAAWYLDTNHTVRGAGLNPLVHFLKEGAAAGCQPYPGFDLDRYIKETPDAPSAPLSAYLLLLQSGRYVDVLTPATTRVTKKNPIESYLRRQREDIFSRIQFRTSSVLVIDGPTISILTPVYKTPVDILEKTILSVLAQTYPRWELCLVDDFSCMDTITTLLAKYASEDARIKTMKLSKNSGISVATNHALSMASGEYIGLLDHDDVLTNDALSSVAESIRQNEGVDLIYSDECTIDINNIPMSIFQKPDWSPRMLFNYMYTGHFSVYRKSLIEQLGAFRPTYDFSQDYDLALRVTEKTYKIAHVPKVLYGWRAIDGSAAAGGKDDARESNIAALADAVERRRIGGQVFALSAANRICRAGIIGTPLVSIIIPSDSLENIIASVASIEKCTSYERYEIVVVTNSNIAKMLSRLPFKLKISIYDKKFNFSAKCSQGANDAMGDYLLFYNDDVRTMAGDWLENLLEYATLEDVGIVGPKLLYENNTIQHAGMVTGVRGLCGTAFHCLEADTSHHYNFAQCVRDVSLICGACLMIRRSIYQIVGGWDPEHFPIAHSDIDLCFKVRALGFHCVYTPYACLYHIGHVSLGKAEKDAKEIKKDKADIALLRKWPDETAQDPFWTASMRMALYHDSPEYYQIYPGARKELQHGRDILLVSHDLSRSGAPRAVVEIAEILTAAGDFVVVVAPEDGPLRHELTQAGVTVIVDEILFSRHHSFMKFAKNFDAIIANTIVSWPVVNQIAKTVPTFWYLQESEFAGDMLSSSLEVQATLRSGAEIWAISHLTENIVRKFGVKAQMMPSGIRMRAGSNQSKKSKDEIVIGVFGSYEPRKGQDLAICAIDDMLKCHPCRLLLHGRILDYEFHALLEKWSAIRPYVSLGSELNQAACQQIIAECDIILIPSRDEALSVVGIEALAAGKIVVCSQATGIARFIEDGKSGFVAHDPSPVNLGAVLARAITAKHSWSDIGEAARSLYERHFSREAFAARILERLSNIRGLPEKKLAIPSICDDSKEYAMAVFNGPVIVDHRTR